MTIQKLGAYDVIEKIGAGGMGEVFRARDTRLGRDVALKLLPDAFAHDADRLARFEREARLLAALNHPNIAAIYGLEEADGKRFLVLELVAGEDLSARIARGPIPIEEALPLARDIAEALEYAHEQGIVHRDLKPANVKITPEGRVKVLDFGLAKAFDSEDVRDPRLSQSPTVLASSPTVAGVILGTAAYMSPEQARGKNVDKRADVFAFGSVLFEMLTGKQAFFGETVSDTLASVLKTQPDGGELPENTPRAIRELLKRCMEKDPKLRLRDIGEARIAIDHVRHAGPDVEPVPGPEAAVSSGAARFRANVVWGVATLAIATAAFFASRAIRPRAPDEPVLRYAIDANSHQPASALNSWNVAFSPDGTKIAYMDQGKLWVRELSRLDPVELPGTENASLPFWSPDGTQVGFLDRNTLRKIGLDGSRPTAISTIHGSFTGGSGACWTHDNRVVFSRGDGGLSAVSAMGGEATEIVPLRKGIDQDFHEPSELPDGRGFLYVAHAAGSIPATLMLYANGKYTELVKYNDGRVWMPRYSPTGHIIFGRTGGNSGVWALPFSLSELKVTGEPFLVAADAAEAWPSSNGTLVYRQGIATGKEQLVWVARDGTVGAAIGDPVNAIGHAKLSPDGRRMAVTISDADNVDVWIFDPSRGTRTRLTFDPTTEIFPAWSPDGATIYYNSTAEGGRIMAKAADGSGEARLITHGFAPSISADGKWIAYDYSPQGGKGNIYVASLPFDTTAAHDPLVGTAADENTARISPRSDYLAYVSDESGRDEVYLTRFPSGGGKWQVSVDGGSIPEWSKSGRKLFFWAAPNLMEVDVSDAGDRLELGKPRVVFSPEASGLVLNTLLIYGVDGEGERFIMTRPVGENVKQNEMRLVVVQNWFDDFKKIAKK
jgi:eukaryotic-like serine/threonine-protein kinase